MTEARNIQVTEEGAASNSPQLAHERPAVERWLSWSGLVPLPAFLFLHLFRELQLAFHDDVSDVLRPAPSPFSQVTSWLLVWLPLLVHGALGVFFLLSGRRPSLPRQGADVPALPRLVSRISGALALVFIAYHTRSYSISAWLGETDARDAGFRLLAELSSTWSGVPLLGGAYLLGLLATVTHAGLAVHRALVAEGLLATAARRETSARACAGMGALLFIVGAAAVIRVATGVLMR